MFNLTVVGNGFDLHHNLKTSFLDFLNSIYNYKENFFFYYFSEKVINNGFTWIDFENEISNILISISNLYNKPKSKVYHFKTIPGGFDQSKSAYILDINDFKTPDSMFFFITIREFGFSFFKQQVYKDIKIEDENITNWYNMLQFRIKKDYKDFTSSFNNYLKKIDYPFLFDEFEKTKNNSIIETITHSDEIINFNYTSTLDSYLSEEQVQNRIVKHVHNKIDADIIIGIGELNEYNSEYNSSFYKTVNYIATSNDLISSFLEIDNKMKSSYDYVSSLNLVFIGHSFGISDHYLFKGLKELIDNGIYTLDSLIITFYSYDLDSKKSFIYNMKLFFGSSNTDKLFNLQRIVFKDY